MIYRIIDNLDNYDLYNMTMILNLVLRLQNYKYQI